ncbi:transmembrane 7 superfamily member 3 [Electrophorus electricus]|uniref:TM7S3/TM198-like domain-containing protein n=1 Tax=Electrophorus electricus TaxID=8005 RepID=A0AAY5ES13_ELEEL|nr:transmembrane 7 superfamily member 3 [Electrophorus electricus]
MSRIRRGYFVFLLLACLGLRRAQDENQVVFSLGMFQNVSVPENGSVQVLVSQIPAEVAFITLQFHTQDSNVTLSYEKVPVYGYSLTAVDAGLLFPLKSGQSSLSCFLLAPDGEPVTGIGVLLPYTSTDPVPGGCNLEFPLENDPNIYLRYNLFETVIRFAPANIGSTRDVSPPACDVGTGSTTRWRLQYDVYQYFLPENDLSEQSLTSGMKKFASVSSMVGNGRKLVTLSSKDHAEVSFNSIPGQGVIYSVIVRDPTANASASYVPVHTYACSLASTLDSCATLGRVSTKVFFTIMGLAGLFVCLLGHRFFKCELFCMGFAFTACFFFVLITRTTSLDYDIRLALTALVGVVGGVILVMTWWRFGSAMSCVVVVGLILGFLISSIVFFTPLGDMDVFHNDMVFWVTFSCIVVVVPVFFIRWPREGNIVACGVVGAYTVVLAVNAYTYTSLSYVTLDVLKRLLNDDFSRAFISVPLQLIDFILISVWSVLALGGTALQLYRERSRPFFPPSPYVLWRQERERRNTNVLDPSHHTPSLATRLLARARRLLHHPEPAGERTPLLL